MWQGGNVTNGHFKGLDDISSLILTNPFLSEENRPQDSKRQKKRNWLSDQLLAS